MILCRFHIPNRYIETDKFLVPTGDINLVQDKAGTDFIEAIELGTNIKQAVGGCGPKCTGLDTGDFNSGSSKVFRSRVNRLGPSYFTIK